MYFSPKIPFIRNIFFQIYDYNISVNAIIINNIFSTTSLVL